MQTPDFNSLSDAEVSAGFLAECTTGRQSLARLLVWLDQVERRELHLAAACSSLWDYCRQRARMSEGEATRRIAAARLVRRFRALLGPIERGEIHLSSLVLLREHLTETTFDALVAEASGKTKREVQEIVARLAPRPDVPARIDKIPEPAPLPLATSSPAPELALPPNLEKAKVVPLAEDRYAVQFTASRALRDKMDRATELLRHRNPSGDLAANVERAFDALIEKLEKEVLAKTARPRARAGPPKDPCDVSRAARREAFARDGEQCVFVDEHGHRCTARGFLQIDHVTMRARGGSGELENLRVLCGAHNRYLARRGLGKDVSTTRRHRRQRTAQRVERSERVIAPVAGGAPEPAVPTIPPSVPPEVIAIAGTGLVNWDSAIATWIVRSTRSSARTRALPRPRRSSARRCGSSRRPISSARRVSREHDAHARDAAAFTATSRLAVLSR